MEAKNNPLPLKALGERIVILGPSSSGKSTLACALSKKTGLPCTHLDRLSHVPHSRWTPKPYEEYAPLHDAAAMEDRWVIDGGYRKTLPKRLERATGLIWLDFNRFQSAGYYLGRCLGKGTRCGGLEGAKSEWSWYLLYYILFKFYRRYGELERIILSAGKDLPAVRLTSRGSLNACYKLWGLERP